MKTLMKFAAALALLILGTVPALAQSATTGDLPKEKFTITSAIRVDLAHNSATLPLHKGTVNGTPVWYVITDVSDAALAKSMGINFAPKMSHITDNCPGCAQDVTSTDPVLGKGDVTFKGMPNFSMDRVLMPGPTGFPPTGVQPGSIADLMYSPFVRIAGSPVVYDAPIVASGAGPFDVTKHSNTLDRVLAIDTNAMTVDLLFIRGFSNGKNILYLSFESSDWLAATLERSTFAPGLGLSPFPNGSLRPDSARTDIFTFVNGATGPNAPPAQGLTHVIVDGHNAEDASLQNTALINALVQGGDAHNVFEVFPTLRDKALAEAYSPLWDLNIGVWSPAAVAAHENTAQTDSNTIDMLASQGKVTSPGGLPLGSANIVINCPALAFVDDPPLEASAAMPGGQMPGMPSTGAPGINHLGDIFGLVAAGLVLAGSLLLGGGWWLRRGAALPIRKR